MLNIFPSAWIFSIFWSRTHKTCFPLELSSLASLALFSLLSSWVLPILNANEGRRQRRRTFCAHEILESICQKVLSCEICGFVEFPFKLKLCWHSKEISLTSQTFRCCMYRVPQMTNLVHVIRTEFTIQSKNFIAIENAGYGNRLLLLAHVVVLLLKPTIAITRFQNFPASQIPTRFTSFAHIYWLRTSGKLLIELKNGINFNSIYQLITVCLKQ